MKNLPNTFKTYSDKFQNQQLNTMINTETLKDSNVDIWSVTKIKVS